MTVYTSRKYLAGYKATRPTSAAKKAAPDPVEKPTRYEIDADALAEVLSQPPDLRQGARGVGGNPWSGRVDKSRKDAP